MVSAGLIRVCGTNSTACGAAEAANAHSHNAEDDTEDDTDNYADDAGNVALSLSSADLTDGALVWALGNGDHGVGGNVHGESSVGDSSVGVVVVIVAIITVGVVTLAKGNIGQHKECSQANGVRSHLSLYYKLNL